jgi:glycosyltransferase involved in cell wall biosynthesis
MGRKQQKIGIGVATYNRLKHLQALIEDIRRFTTVPYDLFVADDGSKDGTADWLQKAGIEYKSGPNRGISYNKNKILYRYGDYQHVFILEDDIRIKKTGWEAFFINAFKKTGENHFPCFPSRRPYSGRTEKHGFQDVILEEIEETSAQILAFTHRVLEEVGGFDMRFFGVGDSHTQLTERIFESGLNKFKYTRLLSDEDYLLYPDDRAPVPEIKTTTPQAEGYSKMNYLIYANIRYYQHNGLETLYSPFCPCLDTFQPEQPFTGIALFISPFQVDNAIPLIEQLSKTCRGKAQILCAIVCSNEAIEKVLRQHHIDYIKTGSFSPTYNKNLLLSKFHNMREVVMLEADIEITDPSWLTSLIDIHRKSGNSFSCLSLLDSSGKPVEQNINSIDFTLRFECKINIPDISIMVFSRKAIEPLGGFSLRLFGHGCEKLDYMVRAKLTEVQGGYIRADLLGDFFEKKIRYTGFTHLKPPLSDVHYRDMRSLANLMTWSQQGFIPFHQPLWNPCGFDSIKTLKIYEG